ncbi:S-adenosyl-L-methionine-dependent methyltransferase [Apiospora sp. TS-2023a]
MNYSKARTSYSDNSMASASGHEYAESQISKSSGSVVSSEYWPSVKDDESDSDEAPSTARPGKRRNSSRRANIFRNIISAVGQSAPEATTSYPGYYQETFPDDQADDIADRPYTALQHRAIAEVWDGRLHLCPFPKPARVLDVGTASGLWALVGTKNPTCHILGIDVDPVVPPFTLPNCAFETVDITQPWPFESKFDYIHARGVPDFPRNTRKVVFDSMWDHLSPGGWIECTNWVMRLQSGDRSTEGTRCEQWFQAIEKGPGVNAMGGSLSFPLDWQRLMTARGCQNLQVRKYPVPLNTWPPGERLQKIGSMMTENTLSVVDLVTGPVLRSGLRWSKEDCEALISDCHKELPDTNYHPFITLMTTYGQKPV